MITFAIAVLAAKRENRTKIINILDRFIWWWWNVLLTGAQRLQVLLWDAQDGNSFAVEPILGYNGEQQVDSLCLKDESSKWVSLGYRWSCGHPALSHFQMEIRSLNICKRTKWDQEQLQLVHHSWCPRCKTTLSRLNQLIIHLIPAPNFWSWFIQYK